jgi:methyl-accepting chemotaxis protein
MLNKLSINTRMLALLIIPLVLISAISYFSLQALKTNNIALEQSGHRFKVVTAATSVRQSINGLYKGIIVNAGSGQITWSDAKEKSAQGIKVIQSRMDRLSDILTEEQKSTSSFNKLFKQEKDLVSSYQDIHKIFSKPGSIENRQILDEYQTGEMKHHFIATINSLKNISEDLYRTTVAENAVAIDTSDKTIKLMTAIVGGGFLLILLAGIFITRSITTPTKMITNVVNKLSDGEFDARVETKGSDEFFKLGTAFNHLLDDRAATSEKTEKDHNELNQSVFKLLQTVAELSEKDLTVRAEVTEDATGPVADALNLLAEETTTTLVEVRDVANEVQSASKDVKARLTSINKLATQEQEHAEQTAIQIDSMLTRLDDIANSANEMNVIADNTTISTKKAHESVTGTVDGMADIRETVQETGKRIKQLGERSQEISYVIEIINTIAERTTVLALNASMQAVAAGDAGRGFSVIAEEIQRLAESSRESTGQISTLVRNIQQETNTTIATMDKTIEQVIDGSTRAEDAAQQMTEVLETTSHLVQSVEHIASSSRDQVSISNQLKQKAESIMQSTKNTGREIRFLTGLSHNMSDFAQKLVQSVNVFTLETGSEANVIEEQPLLEEVKA